MPAGAAASPSDGRFASLGGNPGTSSTPPAHLGALLLAYPWLPFEALLPCLLYFFVFSL